MGGVARLLATEPIPMAVEVSLFGRLGTWMCQYALARTLAEASGLALTCVTGLEGTTARQIGPQVFTATFPHAPLAMEGVIHTHPSLTFDVSVPGWSGHIVPVDACIRAAASGRVILKGYFHRYDYIAPVRARVSKWYSMVDSAGAPDIRPAANDVVLCIRRDLSYGYNGWLLPTSYYVAALRLMPRLGQVYVCGARPTSQFRNALAAFEPVYFAGTPMQHFELVNRFHRVVLSNCASAWWSAFLGSARDIVGPHALDGSAYAFTGYGDVDLHMRSSRYIPLPVTRFDSLVPILTQRSSGCQVYKVDSKYWVRSADQGLVRLSSYGADILLAILRTSGALDCGHFLHSMPRRALQAAVEELSAVGLASVTYRYVQGTPASR